MTQLKYGDTITLTGIVRDAGNLPCSHNIKNCEWCSNITLEVLGQFIQIEERKIRKLKVKSKE